MKIHLICTKEIYIATFKTPIKICNFLHAHIRQTCTLDMSNALFRRRVVGCDGREAQQQHHYTQARLICLSLRSVAAAPHTISPLLSFNSLKCAQFTSSCGTQAPRALNANASRTAPQCTITTSIRCILYIERERQQSNPHHNRRVHIKCNYIFNIKHFHKYKHAQRSA